MMNRLSLWFQRLPTTGKLLIILSAAILPLGLVLIWAASTGINRANDALVTAADDQSRIATRAVESLIARNALALRIASSAALRDAGTQGTEPCEIAARSLAMAPIITRNFSFRAPDGTLLCTSGDLQPQRGTLLVPSGQFRIWISAGGTALYYRLGLPAGTVTGSLTREALRDAALYANGKFRHISLSDGTTEMLLVDETQNPGPMQGELVERRRAIALGQLTARTVVTIDRVEALDRLIILLPVLMWILATLLSWFMVSRFLIRPLRRLQEPSAPISPEPAWSFQRGPAQRPKSANWDNPSLALSSGSRNPNSRWRMRWRGSASWCAKCIIE